MKDVDIDIQLNCPQAYENIQACENFKKGEVKMSKEALRAIVFELAEKILNKDPWPTFKKEERGEFTITYSRTPLKKYRQAVIKIKGGDHLTRLLQSNPAKVVNAKNKVMVYWENISGGRGGAGGTPPVKKVGQVRRYKDKLELVWFNGSPGRRAS